LFYAPQTYNVLIRLRKPKEEYEMLEWVAKLLVKPSICPVCGTKLRLVKYSPFAPRYLDGTPYMHSKYFDADVAICRKCGSLCQLRYGHDVIKWPQYGTSATLILPAEQLPKQTTLIETRLCALTQYNTLYPLPHYQHLAHYYEEQSQETNRQRMIQIIIQLITQRQAANKHDEVYLAHNSFHAIKNLEYKGYTVYDVGRDVLPFPQSLYLIDWTRQSGAFAQATQLIEQFRLHNNSQFCDTYEQFLQLEEILIMKQDTTSH
jgi:hypothetical protein